MADLIDYCIKVSEKLCSEKKYRDLTNQEKRPKKMPQCNKEELRQYINSSYKDPNGMDKELFDSIYNISKRHNKKDYKFNFDNRNLLYAMPSLYDIPPTVLLLFLPPFPEFCHF